MIINDTSFTWASCVLPSQCIDVLLFFMWFADLFSLWVSFIAILFAFSTVECDSGVSLMTERSQTIWNNRITCEALCYRVYVMLFIGNLSRDSVICVNPLVHWWWCQTSCLVSLYCVICYLFTLLSSILLCLLTTWILQHFCWWKSFIFIWCHLVVTDDSFYSCTLFFAWFAHVISLFNSFVTFLFAAILFYIKLCFSISLFAFFSWLYIVIDVVYWFDYLLLHYLLLNSLMIKNGYNTSVTVKNGFTLQYHLYYVWMPLMVKE
jgi:hypothetical protein